MMVNVAGERFVTGQASGVDNNCLIDTLRQLLKVECDISVVREALRVQFPSGPGIVTGDNFLELELHWQAVVRTLLAFAIGDIAGVDVQDICFQCVDLASPGHGDVAGSPSAPVKFQMARIHRNHFIPLIRTS